MAKKYIRKISGKGAVVKALGLKPAHKRDKKLLKERIRTLKRNIRDGVYENCYVRRTTGDIQALEDLAYWYMWENERKLDEIA